MKTYLKIKTRLLKDKDTRRAYEKFGPEFALVQTVIEKRIEKGLTQTELARRIGTKQSAIARLESGAYNPTLGFLNKVAKALNTRLRISLSYKQ